MLTLRNCSFVDPTTSRTSTAMLARTTLGPSRPWSVRALVARRDPARVLRVGVLILKLSDIDRATTLDVDAIDRLFSDMHGVAAFVRQMSGGRRYLEWEAFPAAAIMSSKDKERLLADSTLSRGTRDAARRAGIPVDAFDHWIWATDEGVSTAGSTRDRDSWMGAKDFHVSVICHELMHRLGASGHADASVANDYQDGYCIMGTYGRAFENPRVVTPNASPVRQIAGPGLSAPYARVVSWLDLRNTLSLPATPGVGTRFALHACAGAPIDTDASTVAAVLGPTPTAPADPAQVWFEYRRGRAFDQGIDGGPVGPDVPARPGMVHVSRLVIDGEGPALNPGKPRTYLLGAAPAVVGARLNQVAGCTPRVEVVSSERPLVGLVLDPPVQHAYLFKGDSYVRFDRLANTTDQGYPLPIATYWRGMADAGFDRDLDAVLPWFGQQVYFFKGSSYVRYDLSADRVDPGYPRPIEGNWPGLAGDFAADLDAAVNWGDGFAYVFKGDSYLRYQVVADVTNGPFAIADRWHGLGEAGFGRDLDACLPWYDGRAYFFKGDRYLAYDMLASAVIGEPRSIDPGWPGLGAAGFRSGVRAAFCAPPPLA